VEALRRLLAAWPGTLTVVGPRPTARERVLVRLRHPKHDDELALECEVKSALSTASGESYVVVPIGGDPDRERLREFLKK
jgi:hypothetical protein